MHIFLSLVIPCYNEEDVLDLFYSEIIDVLNRENYRYELIFVNDGSKDTTMGKIKKYATSNECVKYISFSRNFGKESAMLAGLKYAKGEHVGILDADLQHPPDAIPAMLRAITDEGFDIAAARRVNRSGETRLKSMFSRIFYKVINRLADVNIKEGAQDFRIMKNKVVQSIISMPEYHRFSKGIFSWVGFNTKWFEHHNVERLLGESKWNFTSLIKYAVNGIISFSIVPLRLALFIGVIVSLVGFVQIFYILIDFLFFTNREDVRTGFASIMSAIFLVGGTILICVGIIGEYVSRIYIEVKNRPSYIINETNMEVDLHD